MNDQDILGNAPKGATHVQEDTSIYIKVVEGTNGFLFKDWFIFEAGEWVEDSSNNILLMRSLADIQRIAELEKELSSVVAGLFSEKDLAIRDLEQQAKGCHDGAKACSILLGGDAVVIGKTELDSYAKYLLRQAEALKEQGE
jgi:hypothetical protein